MIIRCIFFPLFVLSACWLSAQQPALSPTPLTGALHIAPDGSGGLYATVFPGPEPAIVHLNALGDVRTLVTEKDVRHEYEHQEDGEFLLLHMPGEAWLSGDGARLLFPVFRHVHPWHVAEIMMIERGKPASLLSIDQKLRYTLNGQTHDRYMINGRKAALASDRLHVFSFLSAFPMSDLGERQMGHLSPVSFAYRATALGAPADEITAYLDLDYEDPQYGVVDPGCMSKLNYLFGIGIPSVSFFQPPLFTIVHVDQQGKRETQAADVFLGENAFACAANEASVLYRDAAGRMHGLSAREGSGSRAFFDGNTIGGYPIGEVSHHSVSAEGLHHFAMKAPDGTQGVFTIDAQGRAATVLAPGFAGPGRVVKGMAVSGTRVYLLTDIPTVQLPANSARVLTVAPGSGPGASGAGIVNAASFDDTLSPGAWGTIFGQALATATVQADTLPVPTQLGGISVLLDGVAAPLSLVSPVQINFMVPWELGAPADVDVQVLQNGVPTAAVKTRIDTVSPGIFRAGGAGPFVVTTADYRLVDQSNPCKTGSVCVIWANGLGRTNKLIVTGHPSPPEAEVLDQPTLRMNNRDARILFAGLSPGLAGVYQINFIMPGEPAGGQSVGLVSGSLKQGPRLLTFQIHSQE